MLPALLRLYHSGELTLQEIFRSVTSNPAKLLGLNTGQLKMGMPADLMLFDPMTPWIVNSPLLHSRSKNTPFDDERMQGRVLRTFVAGRELYLYS